MTAPATRALAVRGVLLVLSAPSGAGKSSLARALVADDPRLELSVSHTTRAPRAGEADGVHYHFVSEPEFERLVGAGAFLEHAHVFGRRYGTTAEAVEGALAAGVDLLLEIDWQGARQVRARFPDCASVFIFPPSRAALRARLERRGQDSGDAIERRMAAAAEELAHWDEFDYLVVNDDFDHALADLRAVLAAGRLRRAYHGPRLTALVGDLLAPAEPIQ